MPYNYQVLAECKSKNHLFFVCLCQFEEADQDTGAGDARSTAHPIQVLWKVVSGICDTDGVSLLSQEQDCQSALSHTGCFNPTGSTISY